MSRRIARPFATMDNIRAADAETVQQVEGIGTEKAPSIVAELAPLIEKFAAAGMNMTEPGATPPTPYDGDGGDHEETTERAGGPLAGMIVVVTGAMTGPLEKFSRDQMNELIERAGGRSSSSVSTKTTLVVAGDGAGSKRAKAEDPGIRLVTLDDFAGLVADYLNRGHRHRVSAAHTDNRDSGGNNPKRLTVHLYVASGGTVSPGLTYSPWSLSPRGDRPPHVTALRPRLVSPVQLGLSSADRQ